MSQHGVELTRRLNVERSVWFRRRRCCERGQSAFVDQLAGVEGMATSYVPKSSNQLSHHGNDGDELVATAEAGACLKPRGDARVVLDEPQ
jgi:hypothetical protein